MPSDLTLGLDCSGPWCALALVAGDDCLASEDHAMETGQAVALMPLAEALLARSGHAWQDLVRIGVGTGPGNFTGVRIAVSAARGLALGLGVPAIGVTRFQAAAHGLQRPVTVVLGGPRGELHLQTFDPEPGLPRIHTAAEPPRPPAHPVTGAAAADWAAAAGLSLLAPAMPLAEAIARIAASADPAAPRPAPLHLRPPDAAPPAEAPPVLLA